MNGKCILCGEELRDDDLAFVLHNMPESAQKLPSFEELEFDHTIDLKICQCHRCGLVQLECVPVGYYKDSTRAAERSEGLVQLRQEDYKYFIEKYNLVGKKILEIGAGKGGYLKTLKEMAEYRIQEFGIENNNEYVEYARKVENVNVFRGDPENDKEVLPNGPYDAFMSFSYPARLIKPNEMIKMVYNNLVEDGIGYIMVPSLEHLLNNEGYFDVTRDLIAYYSKNTLSFLFEKNGFDVLEVGYKLDYYLYVIVRKRKKINLSLYWSGAENIIAKLNNYINNALAEGKRMAAWCAGHFAFSVLSTICAKNRVEYIIDNAKFKQNFFAPGSQIPIVGPEILSKNKIDVIFILGPIYVDEIVQEIREKGNAEIVIITVDKWGMREIN